MKIVMFLCLALGVFASDTLSMPKDTTAIQNSIKSITPVAVKTVSDTMFIAVNCADTVNFPTFMAYPNSHAAAIESTLCINAEKIKTIAIETLQKIKVAVDKEVKK